MFAAALADGDFLRAFGQRERVGMHERIVKNDIGCSKQACSADGEQIWRPRTGANQMNDALGLSTHACSTLSPLAVARRLNSG